MHRRVTNPLQYDQLRIPIAPASLAGRWEELERYNWALFGRVWAPETETWQCLFLRPMGRS